MLQNSLPGAARPPLTRLPVENQEYLVFMLAGETYALPIGWVREIRVTEEATRIANAPPYILGILNLRGTVVPMLDLRMRLGLPAQTNGASTVAIIIDLRGRCLSIVVDSVIDVARINPEEILSAPEFSERIQALDLTGLASWNDRLLLLIHLERLLTSDLHARITN